jgi:hypothetical protein
VFRARKARPSRWPFPWRAAALGIVLAAVVYAPIFTGKIPFPADLFHYFPISDGASIEGLTFRHAELGDHLTLMYPWRAYLGASLRRGEIPFWNPHSFAGAPFVANPISAVFYPPNGLFAVFPVELAWAVQFPLRLALAAFFMALLARRIGASPLGAALAGTVFSLCGFMTGWQGWPQADVLLWAPLVLLAIVRLRRRPGLRSAAWLALALVPPILAGHPEVCLYVCAFAVCFFAYLGFLGVRRGRRWSWAVRYGLAFALGALLAGSIAAVQLVPSWEWIPEIVRDLTSSWGSHPLRTALALVSRDTKSAGSPNASGLEVPNEACYAGVAALILAPLALASRRNAMAWFFAAAGIASLGAAVGVPPFSTAFQAMPVFRAMPGIRLLGLVDVCLAVLAGLGLTELGRARPGPRWARAGLIVAASLGVAIAILVLRDGTNLSGGIGRFRGWKSTLGLLGISAGLALLSLRRAGPARGALAALAALSVFDLGSYAWLHVPPVPRASIFPETPTTGFLKSQLRPGERVLFLDRTAPRGAELLYGFDVIEGYPQVLRRTNRLMSPLNGGSHFDILRVFSTDSVLQGDRGLLNRLGVRYLVASTMHQPAESIARLGREFPFRFQHRSNRVFENPNALPLASVSDGGPCEVSELAVRTNGVSGRVGCRNAARLVVAQTFYPGWEGTVGGQPVPITPAGELCSLAVPAGSHPFSLEFRPSRFGVAAAVSLAALGVALIGLLKPDGGR